MEKSQDMPSAANSGMAHSEVFESAAEEPNGKASSELSQSESTKKKPRVRINMFAKRSDTPIKCPECEFRTHVVVTWQRHLKRIHRTKPYDAGVALRCECGHEGLSEKHIYKCNIANFTVVRKRDGPIRTIDDEKTTPKCIICPVYPKSVRGYAHHLVDHHNTTLLKNGVYLICSCGDQLRSDTSNPDHYKKCRGRDYSLHNLYGSLCESVLKSDYDYGAELKKRLEEQKTRMCIMCVNYPKTVGGYARHLQEHHQSTLLKNKIYLLCSCGFEVRAEMSQKEHYKTCNGQKFTVRNLDGSLFESKQEEENGQEIPCERLEEKNVPYTKENDEENINVKNVYRAIRDILDGDKGILAHFRTSCEMLRKIAPIETPRSQWKILLRTFENSEERLEEGFQLIKDMALSTSMKDQSKFYRKLTRRLAKRIIVSQVVSLAEETVEEEYGEIENLFRKIAKKLEEVRKGTHSLIHITYVRIREVSSIKTPLSLWKILLRKFVKSEEELEEGDEFLDQIYTSTQDINESTETREKNYRKLTRRLTRKIVRAAVLDFFKTPNS